MYCNVETGKSSVIVNVVQRRALIVKGRWLNGYKLVSDFATFGPDQHRDGNVRRPFIPN